MAYQLGLVQSSVVCIWTLASKIDCQTEIQVYFIAKKINDRLGEQYLSVIYDVEGKNILKLNDWTATWSPKFSDMLLSYWACGGFVS